jgi:hypothetical protein
LDEAVNLLAASLEKFEEAEVHLHDLVFSGDIGLASLMQNMEQAKDLISWLCNTSGGWIL